MKVNISIHYKLKDNSNDYQHE